MGQEYFINSQELEDKIRQLLPSQGGAGAGFDLSASTQIIPIIDLTESAEGSSLRQDLQRSLSFNSNTAYDVVNATTTIISNTGYFRIIGVSQIGIDNSKVVSNSIVINDGTTDKAVWKHSAATPYGSLIAITDIQVDIIVFLQAGDTVKIVSNDGKARLCGSTRQIADITGTLVNPN